MNLMTQTDFIKTFESFSPKDRRTIARKIQVRLLDDLFEELDAEMPDIDMSAEEIQEEIRAYRNENRKPVRQCPTGRNFVATFRQPFF